MSYRLDHDECERAMLPTLEHASLVHSHIHHLTDQSDEAFAQTRNAIVYISVSTFFSIYSGNMYSASFSSSASLSIAGNPFQLSITRVCLKLPIHLPERLIFQEKVLFVSIR